VIDFWKLVRDFKRGDAVQRFAPSSGDSLSPYVGYVTCVHRGLGQIDVQFPYGNERLSPDELVRVDPKITSWFSPTFDQSYDSYDSRRDRERWASLRGRPFWKGARMPVGFYHELARLWGQGGNEVTAYDTLWHRYAAQGVLDEDLRSEVGLFYQVASRLADLRLQQFAHKSAAYWVAQNRQYRVSQNELKLGKPSCPKCGATMRRTTYKMAEGNRIRLFACPRDLFLVKSDALLGPQGEPLGW
jgi:ribosomal protein S27AE